MPHPAEETLPALFGGKYEATTLLGRGGMGAVYRARDLNSGRVVALKVLLPRWEARADVARRFAREVRAIARLDHPNVVGVVESGEDRERGTPFLAMEFIEGVTLATYLQDAPRLSQDALRSLALGMARALDAAHRLDVIHRDIKPGNVLLKGGAITPSGVRVCDFGLAKIMGEVGSLEPTTLEGAVLGTPAYMAPEQARSGKVDARTDIYAFGAVLFEACSGRKPFEAETPIGYLVKHATENAPRLDELSKNVELSISELVRACLEKDPSHRPSSMGEVLDRLEGSPSVVMPAGEMGSADSLAMGPGTRDLEFARPRRAGWAVFGFAFLVLGSFAFAGLALWNPRPNPSVEAFALPAPEVSPSESKPKEAVVLDGPPVADPALLLSARVEAVVSRGKRTHAPETPVQVNTGRRRVREPPTEVSPRSRKVHRKRTRFNRGRRLSVTKTPRTEQKKAAKEVPVPSHATEQERLEPSRKSPDGPSVSSAAEERKVIVAPKPEKPSIHPEKPKPAPVPKSPQTTTPARPLDLILVSVAGGVSRGRIKAALDERLPKFRACLHGLSGAEVSAVVGFMGRLGQIRVSGPGPSAKACLSSELKTLRMPRPDTGEVRIRFRLAE